MIDSLLKNKVYILLALIVLLAAVIRFYKVSEVPVSLYWDEASILYNAYSVVETGKDEYGEKLPVLFRSLHDYKSPLYVYLSVVSVKIFGLNEFAVRFPSNLSGTLAVLFTFFLFKELALLNKSKKIKINPNTLGLIGAFLLAISPWHIYFSRPGFEANLALFWIIAGAFLFMKYVNTQNFKYLDLSMVILALSVYSYRSALLFVPLLLLAFYIIFRKQMVKKKNILRLGFSSLIFFIIVVPFIPYAISSEGLTRQKQVNIFSNVTHQLNEAAIKREEAGNNLTSKIIYNRRLVYATEISRNYITHFSPLFLFIDGDPNPRHGSEGMGLMHLWEFPFLILGILCLFKIGRPLLFVVGAWVILAPISSALSYPAPHALRGLDLIPIPQLLVALGILYLFSLFSKHQIIIKVILIGVVLFSSFYFFNQYFKVTPAIASSSWADGYKDLVHYTSSVDDKYEKIVVSGHYWRPYIYYLIYTKYDPKEFQNKGSEGGFGKYIFGGTSWDMNGKELGDQDLEKLAGTKNILVALSPVEYSLQKDKINVVKEIKNHNNELVFIIGTLK